eukprot:TRINITY_DN61251_c0_g1_i1.p1 TRINITY_DN61251_c0_g1~~TRINITY_DN61251_c0_g1_i1.p1  ORF type:complete len:470 (+),score=57.44 TRINITY_DN61251_c0_g1_i1:112-1410(+)
MSKKIKLLFKQYDTNGDKVLNKSETVAMFEDLYETTGAEPPKKSILEKRVNEFFLKYDKNGDFSMDIDEFADMLRHSKFWELLEKKGTTKAKKLVKEAENDAIQQVFSEFDAEGIGMVAVEDLSGAYEALGTTLKKDWDPDKIQHVVRVQKETGVIGKKEELDIDAFTTLCIKGPFKFFELKSNWWTKLGKKGAKKKGKDSSSAVASSEGNVEMDSDGDGDGVEGGNKTPARVTLLRTALCHDQPKLLFEYKNHQTQKIKHRVIRLHGCQGCSTDRLVNKIYSRVEDLVSLERFTVLLGKVMDTGNTVTYVKTQSSSSAGANNTPADTKSEGDEDYLDDFDDGGDDAGDGRGEEATSPAAGKSRFVAENVDLNKIHDFDELQEWKNKMDVEFLKNQITKDDPRYVHDVQQDFGEATGASGWDSSDSDNSFGG